VLAPGAVQLVQAQPYGQPSGRQPPRGVPVALQERAPVPPCLRQGRAQRPQEEQRRGHPGEG